MRTLPMKHAMTAIFAGLVFALVAACGGRPDTERTAAATPVRPNVVTITAADFTFGAPSTLPAGPTTIRLVNRGPELHHVQLVRLADGHTTSELVAAMGRSHTLPAWATYVGGPNSPVPGGQAEATLDLEPGEYAMVCVIPSPDGTPHLMKGMVKPIRSGRRVVRVENVARQPHEVILVRLAPGKTVQDMMGWMETMQGPPPGAPIGGTSLLSQGEVNHVAAEFTPGEYALLCMVPDAADGKPHIAHGMARQIRVS